MLDIYIYSCANSKCVCFYKSKYCLQILNDVINQEGFAHLESRTEFTDGYGFTPLLCAVKGNAIKSFKILVSNGADTAAVDINGNGLVEVAILFGSIELFEHLLNDK